MVLRSYAAASDETRNRCMRLVDETLLAACDDHASGVSLPLPHRHGQGLSLARRSSPRGLVAAAGDVARCAQVGSPLF